MATLTYRSEKGSPLTIEEMDNNWINLNTELDLKLPASSYTAANVLTKLKTVTKPGDASGLNADTAGGLQPNSANVPYTIVARGASGSFSAQTITAVSFSGPLFGNTTGTHYGAVEGNTTGTHIGPVEGDVTGNTTGVHYGDVAGNVTGNTEGVHTGAVVGNVTGAIHTATNKFVGNLEGNTTGTHTGAVTGNVTGNVSGNAGTVTNGVYTNVSYSNPSWITGLAGSKVTSIPNSSLTNSSVNINGTSVALGGSATIPFGIKAWVVFNGNNGTIINSYNVDDVFVIAAGNYQINITSGTFANGNYCVSGILSDQDHVLNWLSSTATVLRVTTSDTHADGNNEYSTTQRVNVMMIG